MASPTLKLLKEGSKQAQKTASSPKAKEADLITAVSHEVENMTCEQALAFLPELKDEADYNAFKIGGVLAVIQTNGWHTAAGYNSFSEFVEDQCGFKHRKAMYLIAIYENLINSKVSWDKVAHLGWSKLTYLSKVLTPDNVDEWVAKAEELSVKQLIDYIRSLKDTDEPDGGDDDVTLTSNMTFKVHPDQRQTIEKALEKAMKAAGSDVKTVALEMICLDYLSGSAKAPPKKTTGDPVELFFSNLPNNSTAKMKVIGDLASGLSPAFSPKQLKLLANTLGFSTEAVKSGGDADPKEALKKLAKEMDITELVEALDEAIPHADISIAL